MTNIAIRAAVAAAALLMLAGCESIGITGFSSSGAPATAFVNPDVGQAYLPLESTSFFIGNYGAGFVVAPGIAVTNAHEANLLDGSVKIIGKSRDYDLLFFAIDRQLAQPHALPYNGEKVIAYGQGLHGELREARGVVTSVSEPVEARCETCRQQIAFTFDGDAGPGFSGGPVVDSTSGLIVGVTFGFKDVGGKRVMYGYPMDRIRTELQVILGQVPQDLH